MDVLYEIRVDMMHEHFKGEIVGFSIFNNITYYTVKLKDNNITISAKLSKRLEWYKLKMCIGDEVLLYSENGCNIISNRI